MSAEHRICISNLPTYLSGFFYLLQMHTSEKINRCRISHHCLSFEFLLVTTWERLKSFSEDWRDNPMQQPCLFYLNNSLLKYALVLCASVLSWSRDLNFVYYYDVYIDRLDVLLLLLFIQTNYHLSALYFHCYWELEFKYLLTHVIVIEYNLHEVIFHAPQL